MEKFREYIVPYALDCRRRHRHKLFQGKIIEFSTQLEVKIKDRWYVALRYDTAHGYSHKDILHADGRAEKVPLGISDYNEALTFVDSETEYKKPHDYTRVPHEKIYIESCVNRVESCGSSARSAYFSISDYNEALTFAQIDLDTNWQIYKKRFHKEVGYHE